MVSKGKQLVTVFAVVFLLVSLLVSSTTLPNSPFSTPVKAEETTFSNRWYHDCSNMTSFSDQTDNTWALEEGPVEHNVVNGILESSGTYIYASDFGTSTLYYGPLYSYELTNYVSLADFCELNTVIELSSSTNAEMGRIDVILNDENHAPIMGLSITDGWAADDAVLPVAYWMFGNGSFIRNYEGYENSVQTSYSEKVRIFQNSTGFFSELPLIGTFKLVDVNQVNQSRLIRYVSIHVMKWNTNPVCGVMRLHNISLNWKTTSLFTVWHHDCSNMTAFDGIGDDTWLWEGSSPFLASTGTFSSSMGAIYSTDLGPPPSVMDCFFGPIRYHTFTNPFNILQLHQLQVEIEIDPAGIDEAFGGATIYLHDESHAPIVALRVAVEHTNAHPRSIWFYPNGTEGYQPSNRSIGYVSTPYRDSILLELNSTGVYVTMSVFGCLKVVDIEEVNDAMISYISIMIHGLKGNGVPPFPFPDIVRIHDINLTWISSPTDTTTTSSPTIPLTNTTGWNWGDLPDPVIFLITGLAGTILVLVIVVGCVGRRRRP